ncbi:MAG: manganese efflux pump [bacterium]|nr:manganese efflux pump [bacterium]
MILISISLSLDALGIGISYKLKGVRITHMAKFVVGLVSVLIMWGSLKLGEAVKYFMPPQVANILGISILVLIGLTFIRNALFGTEKTTYDFNKSKNIDIWEAVILGIALSADSISAGIAAVTMGLGSMIIPFCVGGMQVIFLYIGDILLERVGIVRRMSRKLCGVLSGCLLLVIALIRIIS